MVTTIQRWGNSQAIRLPKIILDSLLLQENDQVDIVAENDSIIIRRSARKRRAKKSIDERLETFYHKPIDEILADETLYAPTEYDWGKPMGKEVW
ncbi:MAG: AbrB/MazE/SpoVT family DNA-binding domain-containing protein [Oscillospiraceae bacterium]|nr:AbrB/MazE/SpoVT family DNA-binding domain-containing protein [Oscillospiraceae bacterium]